MQKQLVNNYLIRNKEILFILGIAGFSGYFFIFQGFPSDEYILYAIGIHNIFQNGLVEIPKSFNSEMSFGYYLLIYGLMGLFKSNIELSRLINITGVVSSIVMICFVFKLFYSLLNDKKIVLFICLNVILAPTIWLHTHAGHPTIFAMTFFTASLFYFDKLAIDKFNLKEGKTNFILFMFLSLLALMFRLDIILAFGAYLGIMYVRRLISLAALSKVFLLFAVLLIIISILRYLFFGYLINPTGGRLAYHLSDRFDLHYIIRNSLKNIIYWVVGVNVFISLLALFGVIQLWTKSRFIVMFLSWTLPFCIFLPFFGMDVSRLIAPTVPIIVCVAIFFIVTNFKNTTTMALLLSLIIAQIVPVPMYYLIDKYYPLKVKIDGRYIAKVPMGFLFEDHFYRQKLIKAKTEVAKRLAREKEGDILIIDFATDGLYYIYYILQSRNVLSFNLNLENGVFDCEAYDDLAIGKFVTTKNTFYILCIDNNWQHPSPITDAIQRFNIRKDKIHVDCYISEMQINKDKLYLNDREVTNLIDLEKNIMATRRKIISK